ncbi:hypothetical protein NC651_021243 [Populus alba x Populus x berolinensis]|nr:hypothetical protein NC651_021243 [Populus alba x Populus x berolinensis]
MPLDSKNFRMEIPSLSFFCAVIANGPFLCMLPFYAGRDSMESNYKLDEGCVFGYDLWISFGLKDLLSL